MKLETTEQFLIDIGHNLIYILKKKSSLLEREWTSESIVAKLHDGARVSCLPIFKFLGGSLTMKWAKPCKQKDIVEKTMCDFQGRVIKDTVASVLFLSCIISL